MVKFYKDLILPLVWLGLYSSVKDAETDSLLQLLRYSQWTQDKELMKKRYEILTTITVQKTQ